MYQPVVECKDRTSFQHFLASIYSNGLYKLIGLACADAILDSCIHRCQVGDQPD